MAVTSTKLFSDHNVIDDIQGADNYVNYDSDFDKAYQDLRNYNKGFSYLKNGTKLKILMIPYWVNDSFAGIDYDYMKINQYEEISKYLTQEDLFSILVLQDLPISKDINLCPSRWIIDTWKDNRETTASGILKTYDNSLIEKYRDIVINRLSRNIEGIKPYQFFNTADNIAIVLNSTFFNYISNKDNLLNFLRDLLKEIYTKIPLSMLTKDSSYSTIFTKYLDLIK